VAGVTFQYKRTDLADTFHDLVSDMASPYAFSWDTASIDPGVYSLRAVVTDTVGNSANFDESVEIAAVISDEASFTPSDMEAIITWKTTKPTSSRVVFDTDPRVLNRLDPYYGYRYSTMTFDTDPKVTVHRIVIGGLSDGTVYYYRIISAGSPAAIGDERSFKTLTRAGVLLPPEAGPVLLGIATHTSYSLSMSAAEEKTVEEADVKEVPAEAEKVLAATAAKVSFASWPIWMGAVGMVTLLFFIVSLRRRSKKS
jgi:hypothetical protein